MKNMKHELYELHEMCVRTSIPTHENGRCTGKLGQNPRSTREMRVRHSISHFRSIFITEFRISSSVILSG